MRKLLLLVLIISSFQTFASTVYDTIYINKQKDSISKELIQVCVFNAQSKFSIQNVVLEINEGDQLDLYVINNDSLDHVFKIEGLILSNNTILPGQGKSFSLNFNIVGPYQFYSDVFYGKELGASSIIMYGYENNYKYYWNMFDQSNSLSESIADLSLNTIPVDYTPDIFTINMLVHPELETDLYSKVNQKVGDTIFITLLNSGKMLHTIHFHGYHVEIIKASKNARIVGWIKDSFSILQNEIILVQLVPDKPGIYPVHEHNLIGVTTRGKYPGGMINLINIQQ